MNEPHEYCAEHDQPLEWCFHHMDDGMIHYCWPALRVRAVVD